MYHKTKASTRTPTPFAPRTKQAITIHESRVLLRTERHGGEERRGAAATAAASKQRTDLEDGGEDGAGATPAAREGPGAERAGEEERPSESGPRGQRGCAPALEVARDAAAEDQQAVGDGDVEL